MKKLIIAALIATAAFSVAAQHRGPHYNYGNNWVVPSLITGLIVYGATRQEPQPQIVYMNPPVQYVPQYVEPAPILITEEPLYRKVDMYDPKCRCVKQVYIQVAKEVK